ncbi:NAD(P)/FAD-dependent oxidoreductase [Tundrisphaera sp. TA3]|uniref:NAD(P)/FAD-dependent oxidoreductase n=1 Tax=Tundrisphaera sp. TA3 TaxID=3435775 RepID=UPI003EC06F9F
MAQTKHDSHETAALPPHVVIVGGGFGGLEAAKALNKARIRVTLIDRRNHHLFQPLLYQVATAALNPANIAYPLRRVLKWESHAEVLLGEVESIDVAAKVVRMGETTVAYDYLILATGATHSYFGHDEWAEFAPGLKTIEDATEIRRRILLAFEAAEREPDSVSRRRWQTFAVVGGGPTGVELAGAVAEIARHDMIGEFRRFNPARARVVLIEAGPRILPAYAEDLSASAQKQIEAMGVEVLTNHMVTGIDVDGVDFEGGRLETRTVLWAAGVAASPLGRALGSRLDRAGRVLTERDLTVSGAPGVFVVGDLIGMEQDGKPLPGVAPMAMQSGRHAARNVIRAIRGLPALPFRYRDKGSMATIGRAAAVAEIGKLHLSGLTAWLAWCLIHVLFLIGFRNRALVMLKWGWLYLFHDRGSRLITGPVDHFMERPELPAADRVLEASRAT